MKIVRLLTAAFVLMTSFVWADTYPEVIFDNSLVKGSYAKSHVAYSGTSWVENVNSHLLVSDTLFFTPGNALSLRYLSDKYGTWDVALRYSRQKYHYRLANTDFLSIRVYVKTENTKSSDLPNLYISQKNRTSDTLNMGKYIQAYKLGQWVQVKIPVKDFKLMNLDESISSLHFVQHDVSTSMHHLFVDQIEFLPEKYSEVKLSTKAVLTEATAYDRVVQLKWLLPLTPSIRYVKIYRSGDGEAFKAIGIRPIQMQSCIDIVPTLGQKYYYKISWVDYNYEESAVSSIKDAQTKPLDNDEVLDLIQKMHVNYFVDNFDINSGMYLPYRSKDKVVVSTKETANAILALLIGAERNFVSKQVVLNRISKITYFLLRAQHKHGVFPSYFDGRKGVPEYKRGFSSYDVGGSAALIEALLVARQYFSEDNEKENDLRKRITALYDRVDWTQLVVEGRSNILRASWSLMDDNSDEGVKDFSVMSGANEAINTYLLAIGSNKYPLSKEVYRDAVYNNYNKYYLNRVDEFDVDVYSDSLVFEEFSWRLNQTLQIDTLDRYAIVKPITRYGVNLQLGELSGNLMDLYKPFFTIEPALLKDSVMDWSTNLKSYADYIKRRDNELGVGATSSDIWGFYQHKDTLEGNYRINPAIAPSSIIVSPKQGMASILALYRLYGHVLFTEYGFRSWLDLRNDDVSDEYLALNQAAIAVMLENAKSGFIWKLYNDIPEIKKARQDLFLRGGD